MSILGNEEVIVTNDPDHIRDWMENHKARPATTGNTNTIESELAIKFEEEDDDDLETINWEDFFLILNDKDLAFAYISDEERYTLDSQKYDFVERKEANIEIEEDEIFMNTLETAGNEDKTQDEL